MDDWGSPAESFSAPHPAWAAAARRTGESSDRGARLADVLKHELLPRLAAARLAKPLGLPPADPEALARALVSGGLATARAAIAARLARGASTRAVMLQEIVPAARRLGVFWGDDECDFADVTIAAASLRSLLRDLTPDEPEMRRRAAPSLMIATAPEETHELGADVVAAIFRQAGWRAVRCGFEEGLRALARESFDAAGFSLSCDRFLDPLRRGVAEARRLARNPRMKILLGGPVFAGDAKLAERLGADVAASDASAASKSLSTVLRALRL